MKNESFKAFGVDLSEWNGNVNFEELKKKGVKFCMLRCGYGNNNERQDDDNFMYYVHECEKYKIPWGAYLFSYACCDDDGYSEVDHIDRLLTACREKKYYPTYPIALDVEYNEHQKDEGAWNKARISTNISIFIKEMKRRGYYPIIYSGYDVRDNMCTENIRNNNYWWFAQWNNTPDAFSAPVDKLGIWQYADKTLNYPYDGDYSFVDFEKIIKGKYNRGALYRNIVKVQTFLKKNYDIVLKVSGEYDDETKKAIRECFQIEENNRGVNKTPVNGLFGAKTRKNCLCYKVGDVAAVVALVQCALLCTGDYDGAINCEYTTDLDNSLTIFYNGISKAKPDYIYYGVVKDITKL